MHKKMENLLESNIDLTLTLAEFDTLQWTITVENFIEQIMTTSVPKDNSPCIISMLLPYFSYHILDLIWKVHFLGLYLATYERIIQLKQYILSHDTSLEACHSGQFPPCKKGSSSSLPLIDKLLPPSESKLWTRRQRSSGLCQVSCPFISRKKQLSWPSHPESISDCILLARILSHSYP